MRKIIVKVFFLSLLMPFQACFEPESGCLDVNATNFDVSADDACGDCCNYPSWTIGVRHFIVPPDNPDTSFNLVYNRYFPTFDNPADTFTIERIRYFLSNLKLIKSNGEEVTVEDTIQISINSEETILTDNFFKGDRDIFAGANIGTLITEGTFVGVKFCVGLEENLLNTSINTVSDDSQLNVEGDTLLYDQDLGSYLSSLVVFNRDTVSTTDSTIVQIFEKSPEISLMFEAPIDIVAGFDVDLTLGVECLQWFEGIDIPNQTPDLGPTLSQKIVENLTNSFYVIDISQN